MIWVRSVLFTALVLLWTAVLAVAFMPVGLLPRNWAQRVGRLWCGGILVLVRICCGLRYRVIGAENLPKGAALVAAKHQSAWDTLIFHLLLSDPIYVLKKELISMPVLGWYLKLTGNIPIDRAAGFRALKTLLPEAEKAVRAGAQIVVFPEGTRAAPGESRPYQPGVAALYQRLALPVVPVALNSGLFWGRQKFLKFPGTITLQVLEPIPPGLDRNTFMRLLEQRIETATDALCALPQPAPESALA